MSTDQAQAATADVHSAKLTTRLRVILAVVLIADVLDLMDSTITNIAAPTIVREIGGGQGLVKWLGASYALAIGVLLVVGGRLGDRYGKRTMFIIGIAGFGLASVWCGLSADPGMLVAGRLVQGGFGAVLIPQGIGLLLKTFSREQFPAAVAAFGPTLAGSAVLGPIVAGLIISANIGGLTWRPMFLINIVLAAIGLIAAITLLPPDDDKRPEAIDIAGAVLLGAAMLGLIFGLIEGSTDGWHALPMASIAAGIVLFVAFAIRQRTAANPLILPTLLANRGFTSGLLLGLAYFAAVNGFAYVISLFFQLSLHLSPVRASLGLSPLMVGIMISAFITRPLIPKLGRTLVVLGLLVTLIGVAALVITTAAASNHVNAWTMAPSIVVLGLGMGACFSSIFDVAVGDVAPDEAGSASGSLSAVQQLAAAIGSAVVTTVFFDRLGHGGVDALRTSLTVVGVIVVACLALVWLLPRKAPDEEHAG
ncbi:MFS transporter [uncultured Jatrophihabitans sp.]|uniref:MFS transporter n=1 Tax=uncultured Jatrophihabitans sp. TaxID=1610747 RepID=UPI0035CB29A4